MKSLGIGVKKIIAFGVMLAVILTTVFSGIGGSIIGSGGVDEAYAAAIGKKNEQACDNCRGVVDGKAPSGQDYDDSSGKYVGDKYEYEKLLGGAVYRGGNSMSQLGDTVLDSDPDDFAAARSGNRKPYVLSLLLPGGRSNHPAVCGRYECRSINCQK